MEEVWKDIEGFEGWYQVSNLGRVRSVDRKYCRGIVLKPLKTQDGYHKIHLSKRRVQYSKLIHRLVAQTFLKNDLNLPEVNHINGVKTDNSVENLEWVSHSENIKHSYRILGNKSPRSGLFGKDNPIFGKRGKDCKNSKMVQQIYNGNVVAEFYGTCEASRLTKVSQGNIASCCRGERMRAGGYMWRYK